MCGRYALYGPKSRRRDQFDVDFEDIDLQLPPRWNPFNIPPSSLAPVVLGLPDGRRRAIAAQWGLLPSWVRDPTQLRRPINAKLESAAAKPMFRHAFRRSRVLVPADGFFEWVDQHGGKQPYFFHPSEDGALFALGGLLERWTGPEGDLFSFVVLTTGPNDLVRPIHDRMPVIIKEGDYVTWLDPAVTDPDVVRAVAEDFPSDLMAVHPVSKAVGNPEARGPQLVAPVSLA